MERGQRQYFDVFYPMRRNKNIMPRKNDKLKKNQEPVVDSEPTINIKTEPETETILPSKQIQAFIDLCNSSDELDDESCKEKSKPAGPTINLSDNFSQSCSDISEPPCLRPRLARKVYRVESSDNVMDDEDDSPDEEVRKPKKRKSQNDDVTSKPSKKKKEKSSEQKPTKKKTYQIEKVPEIPALAHVPSTSAGIPKLKINIFHADKTQKPAPKKPVKRQRTPSPIQFDLVPRNNNFTKQATNNNNAKPRARPGPGRKKKLPAMRQDTSTQTIDGKIDRVKDLCCEGCGKYLISQSFEQDTQENAITDMCLDAIKKATLPKLLAIENKVTSVSQKMTAPMYKVPSVKPAAIMPQKKPRFNGKIDNKKDTNIVIDSNTDYIDMDVEQNAITDQVPNLTFSWDKQDSPYTPTKGTADYGPQDFLHELPSVISLIPKGSVQPKAIVKKDDQVRIGQFKELYENPWRPKLLEVEHPPEPDDPTESLVKLNVAFFGEHEPADVNGALDFNMEPELLDVFNDLSDDDEQGDDNAAKFSDDEEDEGALSDTGSMTPIQSFDDRVQECHFIVPEDDFDVDQEKLLQDLLLNVDMEGNIAVKKPEKVKEKKEQEIQLVPPIERLQAEMVKNFNKTPLEMVDDELDFDEDIESPAYEDIAEGFLLKSPSPPVNDKATDDPEMENNHELEDDPASIDDPGLALNNQIATDLTPSTDNLETQKPKSPESDHSYSKLNDLMEMPGVSSNITSHQDITKVPNATSNGVISPINGPNWSPLTDPECSSSKYPDLILSKRITPSLVPHSLKSLMDNDTALKTCDDSDLQNFYKFITKDRHLFMEHFPKIVKEMASRQMKDFIMETLNVCETLQIYIHYKCIVEAMISMGFDKLNAIKMVCNSQKTTTHDAIDVFIDLILDHNCADAMISYLVNVVRVNGYIFKDSSVERLVQCAMNSGNNENWKGLLKEILVNGSSSTELTKQIIDWLRSGETKKIEDEQSPKKKPIILRTVINNRYVKPVPDLRPAFRKK